MCYREKTDQGKETWEWVGEVTLLRWSGQANGQNFERRSELGVYLEEDYSSPTLSIKKHIQRH